MTRFSGELGDDLSFFPSLPAFAVAGLEVFDLGLAPDGSGWLTMCPGLVVVSRAWVARVEGVVTVELGGGALYPDPFHQGPPHHHCLVGGER